LESLKLHVTSLQLPLVIWLEQQCADEAGDGGGVREDADFDLWRCPRDLLNYNDWHLRALSTAHGYHASESLLVPPCQ